MRRLGRDSSRRAVSFRVKKKEESKTQLHAKSGLWLGQERAVVGFSENQQWIDSSQKKSQISSMYPDKRLSIRFCHLLAIVDFQSSYDSSI